MTKAEPGAGDVPIVLDGKDHLMKPSLECCMAISRLGGGGGANAVIARLRGLDFDTIVEVIALGTGYTSGQNKKDISKAVFDQGTMSLFSQCIEFVLIVNNGGRPIDTEEVDEEADDPLASESQLENSTTS